MELEEFKVLAALDMRKNLFAQMAMGGISLCGIFAVVFLYTFGKTVLANASLICVAVFIGYFMIMAQKKIVYLTDKYKLPKAKIFSKK